MTGQIYLRQGTFERLDSFRVMPCMTVSFNLKLDALYRSDSICVLARDGTDSIRFWHACLIEVYPSLGMLAGQILYEFGHA
jgi:hypothetical protein